MRRSAGMVESPEVLIDVDAGTPESTWQRCQRLEALPPADWSGRRDLLVVVPHPDDGVLALGGTLHLLARVGCRIRIVAVTDGESSHPGSTAMSRAALAERRPLEDLAARGALGLKATPVDSLGLPDGRVGAHLDALAEAIAARAGTGTTVVAPWRHDGHPDHEACGRAAAVACAATGAAFLEYPVWMWHWATPHDPRVPWARACTVALAGSVVRRKAAAIARYRSQIDSLGPASADGPVLPSAVLDHFRRPYEVLFR